MNYSPYDKLDKENNYYKEPYHTRTKTYSNVGTPSHRQERYLGEDYKYQYGKTNEKEALGYHPSTQHYRPSHKNEPERCDKISGFSHHKK